MSSVRTLYVGVDVHEGEFQVAVYESDGTLLEERSVCTGRQSVGFIYPIYDALVKEGCDVAVANPNNVLLIARTRIKHDAEDYLLSVEREKALS
jgi:20S proteasome alpha/beta subunit